MQTRQESLKNIPKLPKGIIVWDFDGVLFDTIRMKRDFEEIFRQKGINISKIIKGRSHIRYVGHPFSLKFLMRILKENGLAVSEKAVRKKHRQILLENRYLDPQADKVLHFLRRRGFLLIILSFGVPSFQYPKIKAGCGRNFMRHFVKIKVTKHPKFLSIRKIHGKFPSIPMFFVDDTEEHINLVNKHLPFVKTIHYKSSYSLPRVAKEIISHVEKQGGKKS